MHIDDMIIVMQAFRDGRTIEFSHNDGKEWFTVPLKCSWDWSSMMYRIKPELEYRWAIEIDEGWRLSDHYYTKKRMEKVADHGSRTIKLDNTGRQASWI